MQNTYITKLSIWQCKNKLVDKMLFSSKYGMLEVKNRNEQIVFKIHLYRVSPKFSLQFDDDNKETRITIKYRTPRWVYFAMASQILIMLLFISMSLNPQQVQEVGVSICGASIFFFFLLVSVSGIFAMRKTSFKVVEDFLKEDLGAVRIQ